MLRRRYSAMTPTDPDPAYRAVDAGGDSNRVLQVVLSLILLPTTIFTTGHSRCSAQAVPRSPSALFSSSERTRAFVAAVSPAVFSVEVRTLRRETDAALRARARHPFGGTAFLIDPDGYLLTAASVVVDAGRLVLTAADGKEYRAGVVAASGPSGVALLRMVPPPREEMPYLRLGSSDAVAVGDPAVTLGNPYRAINLTGQVVASRGTVSGRYPVFGFGDYVGQVLETDASVNPGAYGGPLLDASGEVIGIVAESFAFGRWLGTAIPIDPVKAVLDMLRDRETVRAGDVGFSCVERRVSRMRARVTEVREGTAAAAAGLKPQDEIVEFGGAEITDFDAFQRALVRLPASSTVSMLVLRPDEETGRDELKRLVFPVGPPREADLPDARLPLELAAEDDAILVRKVDPSSDADRAGIRPGDEVVRVDRRRIPSLERLNERIAERPVGATVTVRFSRDGWEKEVRLELLPLKKL